MFINNIFFYLLLINTMGNLVSSEAVYNKQDTESLFPKKTDVYTKTESDTKFQPMVVGGVYAKTDVYNKTESDTQFQPKGEYALATSLADYQLKGDYALTSELNNYAPVGNVYTKTESNTQFQPKGDYALTTALAGYQLKGDYALTTALADYQTKGNYALTTALADYAKTTALTTALSSYTKTTDLTNTLSSYTKTTDLTTVLAPYTKTTDLTNTLASYTKTTDLTNTLAAYAKKTDILKGDKGDKGEKGDKGGVQINDTRSVNSLPSSYRARGVNKYFEFKTKSAIGTPSTQEYNYLETIVKWGDASGGGIEQIAYGENIYYRQSTDENTWGPWRTIAPDASGTLIATKPDNWNSAIQIGSTNDPKDSNIYSLSFGKAQDGTWTGMGLVPNDKKAFTDSTGPVLGTHIQEMSEWGIMSSGWNKLFAIQGKTGNVNVKGKLNAGGDIKANNFYTSSSNSFSEMKVNDKGVLFRNGTNQDRISDGGPKTFTVRNDDGDLRLMASGGDVNIPNGIKIGNWKIEEDGQGYLVFKKWTGNGWSVAAPNSPYVAIGNDGNVWSGRSKDGVGYGWITDNIKWLYDNSVLKEQSYYIDSVNNNERLQAGGSWDARLSDGGTGNREKWKFKNT